MLTAFRIKLARWILGKHCACYQMGHHPMVDFEALSQAKIAAKEDSQKTASV